MKYNLLCLLGVLGCQAPSDPETIDTNLVGDSDRPAWDPDPQTISNDSSSESSIAWSPPSEEDYLVDHYRLRSIERSSGIEQDLELPSTTTEYTFRSLRSDAEYEHSIVACLDPDCSDQADLESNEDGQDNNLWLIRTPSERWAFAQNSSRSAPQIVFPNAKDPSALVFENTSDLDGNILLSYTNINTGNILFGNLDLRLADSEASLAVSSYSGQSILGGVTISQFTSSQIKPFQSNNGLNMMMFFSFERTDQSTHIGFVSNQEGFDVDFGGECSPLDSANCTIEFCLNSNQETLSEISSFQVAWESFGLENMGASEEPLLLFEGRATMQDDTSVFYASMQNDIWTVESDDDNRPKKWIQKAKNIGVLNYNTGQSKVYYQSTADNSLNLLYWDAAQTGSENVYDFNDLEDSSYSHTIEAVDTESNPLPANFTDQIGNYHLFQNPIDQQQYLLYTVLNGSDAVGLGLAYLVNP